MSLDARLAQFSVAISDADLDKLIALPVNKVTGCGVDAACLGQLIGDALREMFVPDRQAREILRLFAATARAHAEHHFGTDKKYTAGLYSEAPWGLSRAPAICFTGLAGTGKSAILHALARLLPRADSWSVNGHSSVRPVGVWMMTLTNGDGLNSLLREHLEPKGTATSLGTVGTVRGLLKAAARVSCRELTCIISVDEFQWIAAGSSANARASTVLLKLHSIGPILIYGANFSLVNKLRGRPQEDRDRLLSTPVVLKPLAADDPDWTSYLDAVRSVAPDVLTFDPISEGGQIHHYTFGIKRNVVDLVELAVRQVRRASRSAKVGAKELLSAYRSADFAMRREDVEALSRQEITGTTVRKDLSCPFVATSPEVTNVVVASSAVESFERRIGDAILASAMLPAEAAAHREISSEKERQATASKVLRFRKGKVTKEILLQGAAALDAYE